MSESKELITEKDANQTTKQREALTNWLTLAHQQPEIIVLFVP